MKKATKRIYINSFNVNFEVYKEAIDFKAGGNGGRIGGNTSSSTAKAAIFEKNNTNATPKNVPASVSVAFSSPTKTIPEANNIAPAAVVFQFLNIRSIILLTYHFLFSRSLPQYAEREPQL